MSNSTQATISADMSNLIEVQASNSAETSNSTGTSNSTKKPWSICGGSPSKDDRKQFVCGLRKVAAKQGAAWRDLVTFDTGKGNFGLYMYRFQTKAWNQTNFNKWTSANFGDIGWALNGNTSYGHLLTIFKLTIPTSLITRAYAHEGNYASVDNEGEIVSGPAAGFGFVFDDEETYCWFSLARMGNLASWKPDNLEHLEQIDTRGTNNLANRILAILAPSETSL